MNIDLETTKQALSALATTIGILKQAKDLLPDGKQKDDVTTAIENAEGELKNAEAKSAQAMGYELCRKHWPPEIMFSADDQNWKCSECNNEKYTGTTLKPILKI